MNGDKDYWTLNNVLHKTPGSTLFFLSSSIDLNKSLVTFSFSSSNISLLDQCYLTVQAEMTDLPSGASASQILVVPEVAFPDVRPAVGIWLWSKNTKDMYIFLAKTRMWYKQIVACEEPENHNPESL